MRYNRDNQSHFQKYCGNLQAATFPHKLTFSQSDEKRAVLLRFYFVFSGWLVGWRVRDYVHWPLGELCVCTLAHTHLQDWSVSQGKAAVKRTSAIMHAAALVGSPWCCRGVTLCLMHCSHFSPHSSFLFYFAYSIFYSVSVILFIRLEYFIFPNKI